MQSAAAVSEPVETTSRIVEAASALLATAGITTARLDAEVLLAHACDSDRTALYASWQRPVSTDSRARFAAMLRRRLTREPLQYIVGRQEFWSLDFAVTPDVLIPRPETELLVELTLKVLAEAESAFLDEPVDRPPYQGGPKGVAPRLSDRPLPPPLVRRGNPAKTVCDVGTGSGCIAVALARELSGAEIWALDICAAALAVAQTNARRHTVADRIRFLQSDLLTCAAGMRFDVIISNPPYVSSAALQYAQPELDWEPLRALDGGSTGLQVINRLVTESYARLSPGGWLIMEIGADQSDAVLHLARVTGFSAPTIESDYAGLPRALLARR
jgi:release factor glutamine methyltransferase